MKQTHRVLCVMSFVALSSQLCSGALQAPLPEFQSPQQVAAHRSGTQLRDTSNGNVEMFYTGKAFDSERAGYLFAYRNYSPDLGRWTSADLTGFPDGANNTCYVATPTSEIDPTGARTWKFNLPTVNYSDGNSNSGTVSVSGNNATMTTSASWYSQNEFSNGLTSASLTASGQDWLQSMNCNVGLGISISVNTQTGELFVSQGNGTPSSNDKYLGLAQSFTVNYSLDHHSANLIYIASGAYSGGGKTGFNFNGGGGAAGFSISSGGGVSWSNISGAPVATQLGLTITSYE